MNRAAFYAEQFWGTPFSARHRGVDITQGAGRPVPMLRPGKIVRRAYNSQLGSFVVVKIADNDYDGYGHIVHGSGENVGTVAGWNDSHGNAWTGPHVHLTNSSSAYGIDTPTIANRNPLPLLLNQNYSIVSSGGTIEKLTLKRGKTMQLTMQDETETYFLVVPNKGVYTVPDQKSADKIWRILYANPRRSDLEWLAKFLSVPPTFRTFTFGK